MKDERLRKMNQEYHEIPIPAELRNRVEAGIREAKKDMATENQTTTATTEKKRKPVKKKNKMIAFVKTAGGAVAAAVIAITVMANSGANIRRTGKAVLAVPGVGLREAVMKYGSSNGGRTDKLKETPVALQKVAGSDIPIPEDSRVAFAVSLAQTVEAGDHCLYLCRIDSMFADETREALFAWDGYARVAPAQEK